MPSFLIVSDLKSKKILWKNQNSFQRNRLKTSQILTIRQIIEGVRAKNPVATLLFVDFSKAFDYIHGRTDEKRNKYYLHMIYLCVYVCALTCVYCFTFPLSKAGTAELYTYGLTKVSTRIIPYFLCVCGYMYMYIDVGRDR